MLTPIDPTSSALLHHLRTMTASRADYQYQALSTIDSIRLLSISRGDNHPHGLCLSLKEVSLDDEQIFAALSYTWQLPKYGNSEQTQEPGPGRTFEIACDGRSIEISENLFNSFVPFLSSDAHQRMVRMNLPPRLQSVRPKSSLRWKQCHYG